VIKTQCGAGVNFLERTMGNEIQGDRKQSWCQILTPIELQWVASVLSL